MSAATRILLLSAVDPCARADTDVDAIVDDILDALHAMGGTQAFHASVASAVDIERAVRRFAPTAVFNFCENLAGESRFEPVVPTVLERLGCAYTGSGPSALRHALDKYETNEILRRAGVPVPVTTRITAVGGECASPLPAIVKPDREDGSVGIELDCVVHDAASLRTRVDALVGAYGSVVVQQYIEGRELACALLGYPEAEVLPLGEVAFGASLAEAGAPNILTYASKWNPSSDEYGATMPVTAALTPTLALRLSSVARRAFSALDLRDYGRVDFRLDARGEPYVIDVNPNCDLSPTGGFALAARRARMSYHALIATLVRGALRRASDAPSSTRPRVTPC